ncbi:MAG: PDDEXK nuclease domain-containing protein [Clostridia bacterium]|jgi:predicted nuclease of restriction endonuclease-like (RecB) superfamily|nr:PDDEXK nuclease domain-containing protein [Clostridia bacterium]
MDNKININKYKLLLENVKQEVLNTQYKAIYAVNKELMFMYWHIGKIILENNQWGNKFIDNLSMDLKMEFPEVKGFSIRNLKYMRKFAEEYPDFKFVQEVLAQITWYHNIILMDKIDDIEERKWYIKEIVQNGWSSNMLKMQIDGKVYERQALAEKITNFDLTLPSVQSDLATQTMKDPYIFDFISIKGKVKELEIENAMINKIKDVLIELGKGFAFVGSEYKLEVGGKEYFIDLLFYHLKLKCYIVVELKAREFEPTDAGQLNFYLSAVDDLVKDKDDNATIGLLLCKGKDNFTAEYALKDINKPIGISEYKLLEDMPEYIRSQLPRAEDIELHIRYIEKIENGEDEENKTI